MTQFQPFERLRFFNGRLLSAADLQREQDYFRGKSRLQHRYLHGWGIVAGLHVSLDAGDMVLVTPGFALDCAGNELLLPEPQRVSLCDMSARCYLTLRYEEIPIDPQPLPQGEAEFAAVREAVRLELGSSNPGAGHSGMGPGSPGCGLSHALVLATLTPHEGKWRLRLTRCRLRPQR